MSLFKKNANEEAFVGGKKHWADVIKNTSPAETLIWKQPEEDFNTSSTLIVNPGEEAIFINDSNIEEVFENGTYKLSTNNYPFISRLRNAFTGGISTFNCFVYFVRKADSKEIKWGTDTPIQVRDKIWGIRTDAKVRGSYKFRIEKPAVFLEKLIGSNVNQQSQEELEKYFANEFQGKIKTLISKFLNSLEQELIGIDAYINELSEQVEPYIDEALQDYGLTCVKFSIAGLDIDNSKYDEIDKSQIQSISKVKLAQGDRNVMDIMGQDWGKQQAANILGDMARNPSGGGMAAMASGIGVGMAAGNALGNMANQMFGTTNPQSVKESADPLETLTKLKKMLESGLIEQKEYDDKKTEILSKI